MDARPTRTRLRLGLIQPKSSSRDKGVTDEELEILLTSDSPDEGGQEKTGGEKTVQSEKHPSPGGVKR